MVNMVLKWAFGEKKPPRYTDTLLSIASGYGEVVDPAKRYAGQASALLPTIIPEWRSPRYARDDDKECKLSF